MNLDDLKTVPVQLTETLQAMPIAIAYQQPRAIAPTPTSFVAAPITPEHVIAETICVSPLQSFAVQKAPVPIPNNVMAAFVVFECVRIAVQVLLVLILSRVNGH